MSHFESIFRAIASTVPRNALTLAPWPVNFSVTGVTGLCDTHFFDMCTEPQQKPEPGVVRLNFSSKFYYKLATDVRYILRP